MIFLFGIDISILPVHTAREWLAISTTQWRHINLFHNSFRLKAKRCICALWSLGREIRRCPMNFLHKGAGNAENFSTACCQSHCFPPVNKQTTCVRTLKDPTRLTTCFEEGKHLLRCPTNNLPACSLSRMTPHEKQLCNLFNSCYTVFQLSSYVPIVIFFINYHHKFPSTEDRWNPLENGLSWKISIRFSNL